MQSYPKHAVFFRLSSLGDVALTTGPLLAWHRVMGTKFTVLTLPAFAPLFEGHPAVTDVIPLDKQTLKGKKLFSTAQNMAKRFKGSPFIDCHGNGKSRVFRLFWPLFAQAPVHAYPKAGLARRLFLYSGAWRTYFSFASLNNNVPERYAAALPNAARQGQSLRPCVFLAESEKQQAHQRLHALGLPVGFKGIHTAGKNKPLLALHPFATHPNKMWPFWEELAALLRSEGIPFFWVGKQEGYKGQFAKWGSDCINTLSLRELCAMLSQADVLISADSGPVHLARAVQTQVMALFGPTCKEWGFYPAKEEGVVLQYFLPCQPCSLHGGAVCKHNHSCMQELSPAYVLQQTLIRYIKDFP